MASSTKALVAVLILSLVHQGFCLCTLNDIIVGTQRTGLSCKGFQSVEAVDPNIFQKQGDNCLIIKGNAVKGFTSVSFAYAWDPPFGLLPAGSIIEAC